MSLFPEKLHITKAEINELPLQKYTGPIHLCQTPEEAETAAIKLANEPLLGFDTETRPAFRKGESYDPSLLQLGGETDVYLFQLKKTGFPPALLELLSNPKIIKAGVAIARDISELQVLAPFHPGGFVELADMAKRGQMKNLGLRGITALLFGFRISKKEQVSNWARQELTPDQLVYAATDAWLGRKIYLYFTELGISTTDPE